MHLACFGSSICDVPVPVEAPALTQGQEKQVKCLLQAMFRKKRLVLMKEVLPTRPGKQGSHGERAPTSLERLPQVLFPYGAPHVCSCLPYLNPALPLLVCGRNLKCLVGFKSC